jgi:hypothetical protein
MTRPRIVQSRILPTYKGRFAATRLENHQVVSPEGSTFVASLYHVIDADADPVLLKELYEETLNRVICPSTGEVIDLNRPVVVHVPSARLLFLVIPRERLHDEIRLRMDLLQELENESEALPAYILNYHCVYPPFGPAELREYCREQRVLQELRDKIAAATRSEPTEDDDDVEELTGADVEVMELAQVLWLPTVPAVDDVVRQVRDLPDRPVAEELQPSPPPAALTDVPLGQGKATISSGRIAIHFVVNHARLAAFLQRKPDIFLQLHRLFCYPVVSILVVARDESDRLLDELFCLFDIGIEEDRELLARLREDFVIDIHVYDESNRRVQYLQFDKPLGPNVEYVEQQATAWLEGIEPDSRDFQLAAERFASEGYERVGALRHNFHENSFAHINSAASAKVAVSIVGYWSERQNVEYLIENRSFPLSFYTQIQHRVVDAALFYGIHLPLDLRKSAVDWELAPTQQDLVERLVGRFAELTTSSEGHDLDVMGVFENWDMLLTSCVDLGVSVDDRVGELAEASRRRARAVGSQPRIRMSDLLDTNEYRRVSSIAQASTEDLRQLLEKGGMAPAASRELMDRGGETNILYVIESARTLDDDGLQQAARFLAAGAEQFEPALLVGLGRSHPRTVHLCSLALAMAKRLEALPTLIDLLQRQGSHPGVPMTEILAGYGAAALPAIFVEIEARGPTTELVEVLALISIDHGAEILAELRNEPTPGLLEAAQMMGDARRRLESREAGAMKDDDEPTADDL